MMINIWCVLAEINKQNNLYDDFFPSGELQVKPRLVFSSSFETIQTDVDSDIRLDKGQAGSRLLGCGGIWGKSWEGGCTIRPGAGTK